MADILVIGAGPAGLAIAAALCRTGVSVAGLSAGDPAMIWPNTYGIWRDELEPLGLSHLVGPHWSDCVSYAADRELVHKRAYALIDKAAEDKIPLAMMGYGRTDAVDGSVFPYAFPLVTTYQMQASAILKFIKEKEKGSLEGKKIVFLYHDSAYGKEPIVALQEEAKLNKFT